MESAKIKAKTHDGEKPEKLLEILKTRFNKNVSRHPSLEWARVQKNLDKDPEKLRSLDIAEVGRIRSQNFELDTDTPRNQEARRGPLCRPSL